MYTSSPESRYKWDLGLEKDVAVLSKVHVLDLDVEGLLCRNGPIMYMNLDLGRPAS